MHDGGFDTTMYSTRAHIRIRQKKFFILLSGTEKLYSQILAGYSEDEIRKTWRSDLEKFKQIRAKYLRYD